MEYIDLTHTFISAMPVYPGDPLPVIKQIASLDKDGFIDQEVRTGMHVGTHLDAPQHFIDGGAAVADIDPARLMGRGVLVDARGKNSIDVDALDRMEIQPGDIVLIWSGWSSKFGPPDYFENYPQLTEAFAMKLVDKKISIVGMDLPSPDKPPFSIHKTLLKNDILLIENLTNLEKLFSFTTFNVIALPPKWPTNAAPVRVIARID